VTKRVPTETVALSFLTVVAMLRDEQVPIAVALRMLKSGYRLVSQVRQSKRRRKHER